MYRNPVIPVATLIEPVKAGDPGIQGDLDSGALDQEAFVEIFKSRP